MKTIKQWIETLPVGRIRKQWLENCHDYRIDEYATELFSKHRSLSNSFVWDDSKQGHDYWQKLFKEYAKESK